MLMLVVTIIIAAIVSALAGGLMGESQKAPSLSMEVKISNSGSWIGSGFTATVLGVSEPISTNDLKLITSWTAEDDDGNVIVGGATVIPRVAHKNANLSKAVAAPYGFGNGVGGTQNVTSPYSINQAFGNYTLLQGTGLLAIPAGALESDLDAVGGSAKSGNSGYGISAKYEYTDEYASEYIDGDRGRLDPVQYILGKRWQYLRAGDKVLVNFIHTPTGRVIFSKEVVVTG
jgi:FlaG/FlaF family flagellin (archaellin)